VCADATSLVERFMSTTELHERIYAPYGRRRSRAAALAGTIRDSIYI
jgi:hypothetical protein